MHGKARARAFAAACTIACGLLLAGLAPPEARAQPAPTPCPNTANQTELTLCAQRDQVAAEAALNAAYRDTLARIAPSNRKRIVDAQLLWATMRERTCSFEEELYAGGSIAPMARADCMARIAQHQTRQLQTLPPAPAASAPVDPAADAELNRVYKAFMARLDGPALKSALTDAELAWIAYRDKICALAGDGCLTRLSVERTQEFKAGWFGEPFWT